LKYHRGAEAYVHETAVPRNFQTEVYVYYGQSGIGKTEHALKTYPLDGSVYWWPKGSWFPWYRGQEVVIMDEYVGDIQFTHLLRVLDKSPFAVEPKGTHRQFLAKTVVIISNFHPREWYKKVPSLLPLCLRLHRAQLRGAGIFTRDSWEEEWKAEPWDPTYVL